MTSRYAEIAADIMNRIVDGTYPAGARLPTEDDLAEKYEVTRPTVNRAIGVLRTAGVVVVSRGVGTFVSSERRALYSPGDDTVDITPRHVVDIVGDPPAAAAVLGAGPLVRVRALYRRAHLGAPQPLSRIVDVYQRAPADLAALTELRSASTSIGTRPPTVAERSGLRLPLYAAVLELTATACDVDGHPVAVRVDVLPAATWRVRMSHTATARILHHRAGEST